VSRAIVAVTAIRGWRDLVEVRPGVIVPAVLQAEGYEATRGIVAHLARLGLRDEGEPVASVTIPGGTLGVLPSDDLDLGAEQRRLEARREQLASEIDRAERKLANEGFVAKAPAAVVEAERTKLLRLRSELEGL
jgi:valyl-tRNA synthetase